MTRGRPDRAVPLLAAALLALVLLAPTLEFPYGRDQATFAWVGHTISRGGMPYRDAWEVKPPGIYLAYAAVARVAPPGHGAMRALRLVDVGVAGTTAALLALLVCRLAGPAGAGAAAVAAGAWYAALYLGGTYWSLAQAESWANLPVVAAVLLLWPPPGSAGACGLQAPGVRRAAMAGLLLGAAALCKFTALLPVIPVAARYLGRRGRPAAACGAGVLLPVLAAGAWLAAGGALGPYLEIQQGFVARYALLGESGPVGRLASLVGHTAGWALANLPAVLLAGVAFLPGAAWAGRRGLLPGAVLVGGLAAAWIQGKYFAYHWQSLYPFLAVAAAVGAGEAVRLLRLPDTARSAWAILLPVCWCLAVQWPLHRDGARLQAGLLPRAQWEKRFGQEGQGDYNYQATARAAAAVRSLSRPGETVLVWGFEPAIYLLAERPAASRFFFNVPVTAPFAERRWREELLREFAWAPPRVLVVVRGDAIPWASGRRDDSAAQLAAWPELRTLVDERFVPVHRIEDFQLYLRRDE